MGRRKILFYIHALVGGGAERVFARLASGFADRGDDVIFVVDFDAHENLQFLSEGVRLVTLPKGHVQATLALAQILKTEKPDASLSALGVSNLKHVAAAALAGCRHRAILTYHGFYENERQRLSNLGYRLTRPLSALSAATVAVSNCLRDELIARYSVAPERIVMIYNPATPEPFPRKVSEEELASRPPKIAAVGRLTSDKDFMTLLRAFSLVRHADARLVILGEGPERQALESEMQSLGLEGRVEMPGFSNDIDAALCQARCFAITANRETFSLACVEALAHGLPVVATRSGGPVEIVNRPEYGTIVPVGDIAAIAQALDAALDAPGDPAPRQQRACDFTLDMALNAYSKLIDAVCAKAGAISA